MRRDRLFLNVAAIALWLFAPIGAEAQTTERFSKTVRLGKTGTVDVSNLAGDITIAGGSSEEVRIDAVKRARGSNAAEQLKNVTIEVVESAGRVEVQTMYPRRRNTRTVNVSVDYTVTVPRGATVNVTSASGHIKLSDIDGDVRGESISGNLAASAARVSRLHSFSGNIEVRGASAEANLTVESISGEVTVTGARPRSLAASTVSGGLRLIDVITERTNAETVSGTIEYSGPFTRGGRYEFKSHSGSIVLAIQGAGGFELAANSFSGSINTDIPVTVRGARPGRQRAVRGTFGDGGAVLVLATFSGDLRITKR